MKFSGIPSEGFPIVNRWLIAAVATTATLLGACAATPPELVQFAGSPQDYQLESRADDAAKVFRIQIRSVSDRAVCLSVDDWPNRLGQVSGGGARAKFRTDGAEIPARDTNFGMCVGASCTVRIPARGVLEGWIGYAEFGEPEAISARKTKQLVYSVAPNFCDGKKN